jgi:hypothetical protein
MNNANDAAKEKTEVIKNKSAKLKSTNEKMETRLGLRFESPKCRYSAPMLGAQPSAIDMVNTGLFRDISNKEGSTQE